MGDIAAKNLLDSKRLFYFFHAARLGSFTTAEAALDVAQSAISRQIQQLERDVGCPLLERHGRGVTLTDAGKLLYQQAETILAGMAETLEAIDLAKRGGGGRLAIATPPIFSNTYMPDIVVRFAEAFPDVQLTALEASTGQVFDYLVAGEVDLAVVLHSSNSHRLSMTKLIVESLMLIVAPGHPLASMKAVARSDVPAKLIVTGSPHGSRVLVESYFEEGGTRVAPQLCIDGLSMTKALVKHRGFSAIYPASACSKELRDGELVALPLDPPLKRTLYLARLRDKPQTPQMKVMSSAIAAAVHSRAGAAREKSR